MSGTMARLYNFASDSASSTPISSSKVDGELDQLITALNRKVLISGTTPSAPQDGDTWVDLSEDPPVLKIYDSTNTQWVAANLENDESAPGNNKFYGTDGSGTKGWQDLDEIIDADGDTKIQAEESVDEDKLRFDTGGTQRALLDSDGLTLETGVNANKILDEDDMASDDADALATQQSIKKFVDDKGLKARAVFTGATGAVLDSYNCSSITRNSAGYYRFNFSTALANTNYGVLFGTEDSGSITYGSQKITTRTTTYFDFRTLAGSSTPIDPTTCSVIVI